MDGETSGNVHLATPPVTRGAPLAACSAVAVMVHGRNQTVDYMWDLAERIDLPDVHYVALQAAGHSWYPSGFMADTTENEPFLGHALEAFDARIQELLASGVPRTKMVLLGFSQGACLTAEYAVRYARRYGGIVLYTGGVIGPPGTQWVFPGSFQDTPVFLGTSDPDDWVPVRRVRETEVVFRAMKAATTLRIYPGMGHVVNDEEIDWARTLLQRVSSVDEGEIL